MLNSDLINFAQLLSVAGPTFAIGISVGWILALLHLSSLTDKTSSHDKDK